MNEQFAPYIAENKDELKEYLQFLSARARDWPATDLNFIDVSRVDNMDCLFSSSRFNGDISKWNVSNVDSMVEMFYASAFKGDISSWDTSNVESMANMFQKSAFVGDISKWNTRRVENFREMFLDGAFAGDISQWVIEPSTPSKLSRMFSDAQTPRLTHPNVYCWAVSINDYQEILLHRPWQDHVDAMRPALAGLGLPLLEAAKLVHQTWLDRNRPGLTDTVALPELY